MIGLRKLLPHVQPTCSTRVTNHSINVSQLFINEIIIVKEFHTEVSL